MNNKQLNEQEKNEELVEIGITAYENKDYQKALEAFSKITPSFEQYDIVRGEIIGFHYNLEHYEEVIRLARLETEENESYPIIIANRMRAHLKLEQYQEILDFYKNSTVSLDEEAREHYLITVQNAASRWREIHSDGRRNRRHRRYYRRCANRQESHDRHKRPWLLPEARAYRLCLHC